MAQIIGMKSCASCKFVAPSATAGAIECRYNPPVAHAVIVPTPKGPSHLGTIGVFPPVSPDSFCHRFERGIVAN